MNKPLVRFYEKILIVVRREKNSGPIKNLTAKFQSQSFASGSFDILFLDILILQLIQELVSNNNFLARIQEKEKKNESDLRL